MITWKTVQRLAQALPEVEEQTSHGQPGCCGPKRVAASLGGSD
jgi:hypothetical protein